MEGPLSFAINLAYQAGKLLVEHFQDSGLQTSLKIDRSVLTEADLASDRLISREIREHYPGELILSEELQPCLPEMDTTPVSWIIDPLDGTTNFSLGLYIWGVLIARLVNGWPEVAVMYFPKIDELYYANRGAGAFLNGRPIHVQPPEPDRPFSFFSCCSRTFRRYDVSIPYKARILGSAGYSFCSVARGIAVVGFEAAPKIWDISGPWLLVSEAGGVIKTLDGSQPFPLRAGVNYSSQNYPTLAAASPEQIESAQAQIRPKVAI